MVDRSKQQSKLELTAFSGVLDNPSYAAPKLWKVRYDSTRISRSDGQGVSQWRVHVWEAG